MKGVKNDEASRRGGGKEMGAGAVGNGDGWTTMGDDGWAAGEDELLDGPGVVAHRRCAGSSGRPSGSLGRPTTNSTWTGQPQLLVARTRHGRPSGGDWPACAVLAPHSSPRSAARASFLHPSGSGYALPSSWHTTSFGRILAFALHRSLHRQPCVRRNTARWSFKSMEEFVII